MRKSVTEEKGVIKDSLDRAEVLWLALCDADGPHCVPVNFAYDGEVLYVHSGGKGRKAACLDTGAKVAFSTAVDVRLRDSDANNACDQGYHFKSVMGSGSPRLLEGDEKLRGLDAITVKYLGKQLPYLDKVLPVTVVYAIDVQTLTARVKGA